MKSKHARIRAQQCLQLATASNCPRRQFGSLLLDPVRNVVVMDGYNGGPRGGSSLCGGEETCLRTENDYHSGTHVEVGCVHAEMNVICNAARCGVSTDKMWLLINGEPCMMCAKLIHHSGIAKIVIIKGVYETNNGIEYLLKHGVDIVQDDLSPWQCK